MITKMRGDFLKRFFKFLSLVLSILSAFLFTYCIYISSALPDSYKITQSCGLNLENHNFLTASVDPREDKLAVLNKNYKSNILLMSSIPVKTVNVELLKEEKVTPCGVPFGVKMFTDGVLVVGISDIKTDNGLTCPAKAAGLKKGDIITKVNTSQIKNNEYLLEMVENSEGKPLECEIVRNSCCFKVQLQPTKSSPDNIYRLGLWVRDSSAGIGTLTFFNEKNHAFAGLGHGICDVDTGDLLPLSHGDIVKASVSGIVKGVKGMPGELKGYFIEPSSLGVISKNTECGVYGGLKNFSSDQKPLAVAMKQQVKHGRAQILSTVSGTSPRFYDIEIQNINYNEKIKSKNMIIKITDEKLLDQTGGIVQGMSGSPIIQNDMLVGAVTHVFVNDPQKGYGIFAENMLSEMNEIKDFPELTAS